MKRAKRNNNTLPTFEDFSDVFSYASEKERIKIISNAYRNMSVTDAFAKFFNTEINPNSEGNIRKENIFNIELGKCYWGNVESISKSGISFTITGVKEEIVSKENFSDCLDYIQNYLLQHDNKLRFEVREKRHGIYYVSVLNGYYRMWNENIESHIRKSYPIDVHIDSLTKGGYLCHTTIKPLKDLTGKEYTSSVFIPGSNIVLNIERDFEKWVGKDVQIIPQKFAKFAQSGYPTENSLIGSRKLVLQQLGNRNLYDIYTEMTNIAKLSETMKVEAKMPEFEGTVTGIINSNKNTGIFVELNDKYITGLMPIDSNDLLNYKPGDQVKVRIKQFEVQEGKEPFAINKATKNVYSNTRCIFELA